MSSKIGPGTISGPIFFLGILVSIKIGRTFCLGTIFLNAIGISKKSVLYNTLFISLALFIAGFILGLIFEKNEGASFGKNMCIILGAAVIIFLVAAYGFHVDLLYPFRKSPI
ncbi:MAG TPA: hypothetical protein VIO64_20145 [Pseudobacteroides sp.]|uniref:hypothetical protein n=1 Tax=Pseudobacteroides sp. TaxID=1968840 RepID=UPI002F943A61